MNADTLVKLVEKSGQTTNDIGEIVYQEKLRTIYAQRKYVRQSEFFQIIIFELGFVPLRR